MAEKVTRHPAYAQIGAYRVSGTAALYDSDFRHNHFMTIKISRSELHRGLNRDWHFGREEIVEIAMSESQWATFVSSPNIGSGVPCTLTHFNGERIPGLPDPQARADQFRGEIEERLASTVKRVRDTIARVDELGIPKAKAQTLKGALNDLLTELGSNLPFVASQFEEHMEDTVEKAKQEVHGYMTATLQRAGIEALTGGQLPLQIEVQE